MNRCEKQNRNKPKDRRPRRRPTPGGALSLALTVWCGVVWCGVVWCGVVWCGVVWCGVVWCGVVCCAVCMQCGPSRKFQQGAQPIPCVCDLCLVAQGMPFLPSKPPWGQARRSMPLPMRAALQLCYAVISSCCYKQVFVGTRPKACHPVRLPFLPSAAAVVLTPCPQHYCCW